MKEKIIALFNKNRFLILFFVFALIIHLFLPLDWADDAVFLKKTADKDIFTFLSGSARPFTDGLTYIFSRNQWLWRIFNPCILTTLLYAISKTTQTDINNKSAQAIILTAVYPTMFLVDAGFVATSLNYLWPVTFGILNLIPLINSLNNQNTNKILMIFLIPLLVYATNMQQMCAVLLVIFAFSNIYLLLKRNFSLYNSIQFIITLSGALFSLVLNFSGDNSRMLRETERYFPEFEHLNFFQKTELGFSSTFYCMTMEMRQAFAGFIIFTVFLAIMIFKHKKDLFSRIISLIPIIFSTFFAVGSLHPELSYNMSELFTGDLFHHRLNKAFYSFEIVPDIFFVIILTIMIYSICVLIKNKTCLYVSVFIFMLGLGSRMIMGFSPTVWASGYRTYCIMFISFIYISLIILKNTKSNIISLSSLI